MLTPVSFMRKRSAIVLMVILCILGAAFSIYYFHYVPGNRQRLHRYGFTTLERISENIIARNKDLAQLFSNERLVTRALANIGGECVADNTTTPGLTADHRFSYRRDKDSLCKVNTKAVLSPILSFRHELFSHYLLLYKTGSSTTLAYADDGLGADAQVAADSLGALTNRHPFAQISTVSLNGETYQLFTHPFLLGDQQMVLCGLVPNSNYDSRLRDIPISFIYPLVILLIFVLICLPFARVYLIGRGERTGFGDALGIAVSVFIGMALTATIVIQVLLLSSGNQRAEAQMATLSDSIKHHFHAELQLMYNKLKAIDQLPDSLLRSERGTAPYTITVANKGTLRHYRDPLPGFFNYDRVFWGDREGRQAIFANSGWGANVSSNVNLNDRQYYRYFRLREPSSEEADFWVETVNSWALGDFRLNMAIRSRRPDMVTAVMSSRMYSVINVIMPPGYQFCLINAEGDVILHSQEARSLKENILEESGNSRELREAISSRQNAKIRNIQCYGANHTLFIHALSGLPYYLVILHDSNYIVPLNMRILLFALMFTTLLCAFILGMLFLLRSGTLRISWLFPVMRYFSWAVPRPSMLRLYDFGSIFLLIYMLLLLFPNIHSDPGRQFSNDHTTLVLVMLAPINAMLVLHVYRLRYLEPESRCPGERRRRRRYILWPLVLGVLCACMMVRLTGLPGGVPAGRVGLYQLGISLLMLWLWKDRLKKNWVENPEAHVIKRAPASWLYRYSMFVMLLALFFSAMPVSIFTWFAHSHELTQAVKKQQLFMAKRFNERLPAVMEQVKNTYNGRLDTINRAYNNWLYRQGIYGVCEDQFTGVRLSPEQVKKMLGRGSATVLNRRISQDFYLSVADLLSSAYYDPIKFPALKAESSDGAWFWLMDDKQRRIDFYMKEKPVIADSTTASRMLYINSTPGPRYYVIGRQGPALILILIVLCILGGMFSLFSSTVSRLFLLRFIRVEDFKASNSLAENPNIYKMEKEVLDELEARRGEFEADWELCSREECLVLMDLAHDGLVNYNNTRELKSLIARQLVIYEDEQFMIVDYAFRRFLVEKRRAGEEAALRKKVKSTSVWEALRTPLLITVMAIAIFIFLTQDEVSRKIGALITTASTALPLLTRLLWARADKPAGDA